MSASMTFAATDLPAFEAIIGQLIGRAENMTPLMQRIGMYGESSTIDRFNTETAPDGSRWTPSARAKAKGGKTLTDTARGKQSMTHRSGRNDAEWGTNVGYMGAHQDGVSKTVTVKTHSRRATQIFGRYLLTPIEVIVPSFQREMNLPARKFLGLSAEDEAEIVALGEDYLAEVLPR